MSAHLLPPPCQEGSFGKSLHRPNQRGPFGYWSYSTETPKCRLCVFGSHLQTRDSSTKDPDGQPEPAAEARVKCCSIHTERLDLQGRILACHGNGIFPGSVLLIALGHNLDVPRQARPVAQHL